MKILIIDDDRGAARALQRLLQARASVTGVEIAESWEEGLKKAVELKPHVVVVDLDLSTDMGPEETIAATGQLAPARWLAFSGNGGGDLYAAAIAAGAQDYLLKPAVDAVERILLACSRRAIPLRTDDNE